VRGGIDTGRGCRRAPFFLTVLALLGVGFLANPNAARGQLPDAIPTWWHEAAGLTPLLTAPPPENPATICIIDTGVTPTPDLDITARWAYDGGTLDDIRESADSPGHGTLVAHFAAAAVNGWGGAGAFPHAQISSVRVFPREGGASWQDYIRAITRCIKLDANTKVIVISIGGQDIDPGEADELAHWIQRARDEYDASVVVAAGNGGDEADFPARFTASFTVAATGPDGKLCPFSARGAQVDLAAPGCALEQVGSAGQRWQASGTSFAAPIVGGLLAALRAYQPDLSARESESVLLRTASPDEVPGLDARAALRDAGLRAAPQGDIPPSEPARSAGPIGAHVGGRVGEAIAAPRVRVRRVRNRLVLLARNRPASASFEVRIGRRRLRSRSSRISVRSQRRRIRCRYATAEAVSRWITVRL
jgi:subtilisin family serine protease